MMLAPCIDGAETQRWRRTPEGQLMCESGVEQMQLCLAWAPTPPAAPPRGHYYTIYYFSSQDDGSTWHWTSRIDQTKAMPSDVEGPCEPTMVRLRDGRLLTIFREVRRPPSRNLWKAYSNNSAKTWSGLSITSAWSVWPQLVLMSNGILALSSGRPGVGLWLSLAGDGLEWTEYHNVIAAHNKLSPTYQRYPPQYSNTSLATGPDSCDTHHCMTTAYTGLVEVEPGVLLLAYDRRHGCETWPVGHTNEVYSMRVRVSAKHDDHAIFDTLKSDDEAVKRYLPRLKAMGLEILAFIGNAGKPQQAALEPALKSDGVETQAQRGARRWNLPAGRTIEKRIRWFIDGNRAMRSAVGQEFMFDAHADIVDGVPFSVLAYHCSSVARIVCGVSPVA